jgi:hypothetical protein
MTKFTFLTLVFSSFVMLSNVSAQKKSKPTMSYEKGFWGSKFRYGVDEISVSDAGEKFEYESPEAFAHFKKARTAQGFAYVTGIGGGFLIGYEGASALRGAKVDGTRSGIGIGLFIVSLLLESNATKNFSNAAESFNNRKTSSTFDRFELNLVDVNTVGVRWRF